MFSINFVFIIVEVRKSNFSAKKSKYETIELKTTTTTSTKYY